MSNFGVCPRPTGQCSGSVDALHVKFWGLSTPYRSNMGSVYALQVIHFGVCVRLAGELWICLRPAGHFSGSVYTLQVKFGGSDHVLQVSLRYFCALWVKFVGCVNAQLVKLWGVSTPNRSIFFGGCVCHAGHFWGLSTPCRSSFWGLSVPFIWTLGRSTPYMSNFRCLSPPYRSNFLGGSSPCRSILVGLSKPCTSIFWVLSTPYQGYVFYGIFFIIIKKPNPPKKNHKKNHKKLKKKNNLNKKKTRSRI